MKTNKNRVVPKLRFPEFYNNGEWKIEKLESITHSISSGKDNKASNGDYPLYGSTGIIGETDEVSHVGSYILVARVGANAGLLNFVTGEFGVSDNTLVVSVKKTSANINFIYYFLTSYRLNKLVFGSGQPLITGRQLKSIELGLPNIEEQKKIADCLSSLDTLINAENEQLDILEEYKAGLLQQLFPAEGETTPKLRFAEFKDDGDWEEVKLVDLAKFRRGSFPQPYGLAEWYDDKNGMPFVQVYDVSDNLKLKSTTKRKISKLATEQSVFIPEGTLIITIQGSIGRVAITQYDAYIDRTLLIFQEFFKPVDKFFLAYVLQLLFYIEKQKAPGGIIKTITKEALSSFKINLPDIGEQQKIADCLSSLDNLIQAKDEKIKMLKEHKQGLMQQLFPTQNM
ncbi:restriction endonuclease subunit S [uncultured Psychrobacter sp.]|uniref:restriction endonuclease subunit S n=1 Tax=uncultured Psychrobacter sp. TaxID=259303 RepID=UPI0025934A7D|nr:restriction endonuclease subunit S [uncultured Psychrobacter sp.]